MNTPEVPYVNFKKQYDESKDALLKAIDSVMSRGAFILGPEVEEFEKEFALLCDTKFAASVANGTDSLIIALKILGIKPGDEVITASNSWISSASAIALTGAIPVFADVLDDQNIDPQDVRKKITAKTKCIMPVHLTGRCAAMGELTKISTEYSIPILEDAAQAVTAKVDNQVAGSIGIMGSFSLHPLKNLNAAGDAGILTTNDETLYQQIKLYRNHGLKNRDEVDFWGYNSRLDNLQAAILLTRIHQLPEIISARRKNATLYTEGLSGLVKCPVEKPNEFHTYHVYVIQCDKRNELQSYLTKCGIETKIHYPIPIHQQNAAKYLGYKQGSLPITEQQKDRILSLPINQYTSEDQIQWVIKSIRKFYGRS
ncbi:MAG: DegT/DnrJ/EryC1/StrS family aminotransferase [Oligoflexia bacterium]|nr:DegT/DnrJ/EryC1/StrS family aminotransferase [Oligoflexia bacterium]